MAIQSVTRDELVALLARTDVKWMSEILLGTSYDELKKLIYPFPPYKHFLVLKRDGTFRQLAEPRLELKLMQQRLLSYLEERAGSMKPCVHGFVRGRSILTNARQHCFAKNHHILNLDLQDFFPSITFFRVRGVLQSRPFNFSYEVATVLAHLCTLYRKLPQGAPTSPFLANLVCRTMDRDLANLARQYRATYTRYADDMTFSFGVRQEDRLPSAMCSMADGRITIGPELHDLITKIHHFEINPNKTRLLNRYRRMEVTGLTINEFPNVRRKFVDKIRGALNAWKKYGYAGAQRRWEELVDTSQKADQKNRFWKRQTRTGNTPALKNVLWGKLLYLRMVRGKNDLLYARLAERYNALVKEERRNGDFIASMLPVELIVRDKSSVHDATFVIEWTGNFELSPSDVDMVGGQGTAFAYREPNLFVTCDHVFGATATIKKAEYPVDFEAEQVTDKSLCLIRSGTKDQIPAKILFRSAEFDIALVAFEDDFNIPDHKYFAPMEFPIETHGNGFLIGFPNYRYGNFANILDDSVLNRTVPTKGMDSFIVKNAGSIRPGNSGGPFTDEQFRVAGVAQRGAFGGTGDDECLCFRILDFIVQEWKQKRDH